MTALAGPVELGPVTGEWVWLDPTRRGVGQIPVGVRVDHGDHTMLVAWAEFPGGPALLFTLDALVPLTVREPVLCSICNVEGQIESGAWLPAEGGDAR